MKSLNQEPDPSSGFISADDAAEAASLTYDDLDKTVTVDSDSVFRLLGSYDFQSAIVKFKSPALS